MDTPRSASPIIRTEAALDDHRFQAHSLPRTTPVTSPVDRRTTLSTNDSYLRPDVVQFAPGSRPSTREREVAVIDDDEDDESGSRRAVSPFLDSQIVDGATDRRPSVAHSTRPRADTGTRRGYSTSSRSPSPPNSVTAFANPEHLRRVDRSATVSSQVPPDLILGLRRTASRRQTITDADDMCANSADDASQRAEEDVCFPPPEETRVRGGIDFDEMEEFIANFNRGRATEAQPSRRRTSSSLSLKGGRSAYMQTLRTHSSLSVNARDKVTSQDSVVVDDSVISLNEKVGAPPASPVNRPRRVSNPDRFTFFCSEMDTTIHAPEIADLLCEGETFYDLFRGGQGVWWLDCFNPTNSELAMLTKAFAIHPLTSEDIRVQETREKVELFKSYYFVCFRSFVQQKGSEDFMEPVNVYVIVFREGVLSFYFAASPHSGNVRKRIRALRDYVALSSDWICYALIDDITDSFGPVIHDIERETEAIEDAVFVARSDDYTQLLRQIGDCRKKCMGLMRLLGGKADVIKGFAKRCNEQYHVTPRGEIGLYLGDIQDHVITMMGNLSHFEKMLSRSHSNYLAQLSVDSIQANNRANEVLGKITTIATILVPLNLICGLFGMNVHIPGQNGENLNWFFGILGTILLFVFVAVIMAKKWRLM